MTDPDLTGELALRQTESHHRLRFSASQSKDDMYAHAQERGFWFVDSPSLSLTYYRI